MKSPTPTPLKQDEFIKYESKYRSIRRGEDKIDLLLPDCVDCGVVLMNEVTPESDTRWQCPLCDQKFICSYKVLRINEKMTGFCNDCGNPLDWEQTEEEKEDQIKQLENLHYRVVCAPCLGKGHIITDTELENVKVKKIIKKVKN